MNTALVLPTIRIDATRTAMAFLEAALADDVDLSEVVLIFSTDGSAGDAVDHDALALSFPGLRPASVLRQTDRTEIARHTFKGATDQMLDALVRRPGYAQARNAGMIRAQQLGCESIVFIDDDVWPFQPLQAGNSTVKWSLTRGHLPGHLRNLASGNDISTGGYMGYTSPLCDLVQVLGGEACGDLWTVIQRGLEFSARDWQYHVELKPRRTRQEMMTDNTVWGGNLAVSTASLQAGRVPPFFQPENARGDDTFFDHMTSMIGTGRASTPVDVFHDPFQISGASSGMKLLPERLPSVPPPTPSNFDRSVRAIYGWIRYIPLHLSLTTDRSETTSTLIELKEPIERLSTALAGATDRPPLSSWYRHSIDSAQQDLDLMKHCRDAWIEAHQMTWHADRAAL